MSRGPLPSKLCFLSSLPRQPAEQKVRFLGCVTSYNTGTATLTLGHRYPEGADVLVSVNIELVLASLPPQMTRVGEWVNVIGYVKDRSEAPHRSDQSRREDALAFVQALAIWPTGPLNVQRYERALEENDTSVE